MWIVAGLGNPGREYEETRHNIGFKVVERVAELNSASSWKEKNGASTTEVHLPGAGKALLVKPLTYMNRSGDPLAKVANFYKVEADRVVVVHDEVDIPFGQLRIKVGGGDGGHNGLKSVKSRLGTAGFIRVRVGVGRPVLNEEGQGPDMSDWVLGRFAQDDKRELPALIDRSVQAVEAIVCEGVKNAQNLFN